MTEAVPAPPTAEPAWRRRGRGGRAGNGFFIALIRYGGMWVAPFFLFWVAGWFLCTATSARRASFDLAQRLGRGGHWLRRSLFAWQHFYTFGMLMLDRVAILGADQAHRYAFTESGEDEIRAAAAAGGGVLLQGAHLGNWEVMGQMIHQLNTPFCMVMFDAVDEQVRATMEDMARHRNFRIIYSDGSPTAAAAILSALREGCIVGLMGDRVVAGDSIDVQILDSTAALPGGAYVLAAAARAPLFHVFAIRTGWRRYAFSAHAAGILRYQDRRNKRVDIERWARAFAALVDENLRRNPFQWGNFFPFWTSPK